MIYWPQKLALCVQAKGLKYQPKEVDLVAKGLWS